RSLRQLHHRYRSSGGAVFNRRRRSAHRQHSNDVWRRGRLRDRRIDRLHRDLRFRWQRGHSLAVPARGSRHDRSGMTRNYIQSREVQPQRRGVRRFVLPLAIASALLVALLSLVAWLPLQDASDLWLRGRGTEAIAIGEKWSWLHLWPTQYHQLLAAAYLTSGNPAAARKHLVISTVWHSIVPKAEVGQRLIDQERYGDFLAYDKAFHEADEEPNVAFFRAGALVGANRIPEAQRVFAAIRQPRRNAARYIVLQRNLAGRAAGIVPYVFDRNGGTIAALHSHDVTPVDDDFAPLISRDAGELTIGAKLAQLGENATIDTTLDPFVQ